MQCKDIVDQAVITAINTAAGLRLTGSVTRWDVGCVLSGHPGRVLEGDVFGDDLLPEKLVLAKLRKMIRRGSISGCACGCAGDLRVAA